MLEQALVCRFPHIAGHNSGILVTARLARASFYLSKFFRHLTCVTDYCPPHRSRFYPMRRENIWRERWERAMNLSQMRQINLIIQHFPPKDGLI